MHKTIKFSLLIQQEDLQNKKVIYCLSLGFLGGGGGRVGQGDGGFGIFNRLI